MGRVVGGLKSPMRTLLTAVLLAQLLILHWTRGYYVAGWELLGAADGTWSIYQEGVIPSVIKYWHQSRHFQYWDSTNSVISTVLPGLLNNYLWPSLWWGYLVWFVLYGAVLSLTVWALKLSWEAVLVGLLSSPVLLSFSITGFPYFSCVIPWLLGIALLRREYNLLWFIPVTELSFHCYELGRSVMMLPLIAAVTLPMTWGRRIVLSAVSGLMAAQLMVRNQSTATVRLEHIWRNLQAGNYSFPFDVYNLWIPGIALLAGGSLLFIKKDRFFWSLLWLSQITLPVLAALNNEAGLSRRYILLDMISVIIFAVAVGKNRKVLLLATPLVCWTLYSTINFKLNPDIANPLPYMASGDFWVNKPLIDQAETLAARASIYRGIFTVNYGYDDYQENTTNPQGVPERILLQVGPKLFEKRVMFLGEKRCRYSCLPMYSLEEQEEAKQKMRDK